MLIVNRERAQEVLANPGVVRRLGLRHVLSIGDPGEDPLAGFDSVGGLRLAFWDADFDEDACSPEDIEHLVHFAEGVKGSLDRVLVHCGAGKSRSTAAALILHAVALGPGRELEAVGAMQDDATTSRHLGLRSPAQTILPQRRMVWMADAALGRNRLLWRALNHTYGSTYRIPFDPAVLG